MENGIFGFQPWAVLLVFIILILIFIIWSSSRSQKNKVKKYAGKLLVLMFSPLGLKFYICTQEYGEIQFPEGFEEEYGKVDKKSFSGKVKIPSSAKKQDVTYFVQPQFEFDCSYPPEKKFKDRVNIKAIAFFEGIPLPIVGIGMKFWTSEMLQSLASTLLGKSRDVETLSAFSAQDSGFWNNIEWIRKQIQSLGWMKIACLVAAGAGIITLVVTFTVVSGKLDTLLKIWTGG